MLIKSKLILALFISSGLVILGLVFLFYAYKQQDIISLSQSRANESLKGVFELSMSTTDYLLNPGERAQTQWYQRFESCSGDFEEIGIKKDEGQKIKERIMQNHSDLKNSFDELVRVYSVVGEGGMATGSFVGFETPDSKIKSSGNSALVDQLASSIIISSQNIVSESFRFVSLLNDEIFKMRLRIYYAEFFVIIFLFIVILILVFIFYNNIIHPIIHLNLGVKKIVAGKYGYQVPINGNDEIARLSGMFNEMSEAEKKSRSKLEEQTEIVKEKQQELEEQKEAVLNVLEDVEEERDRSDRLVNDLEKFKLAVKESSDHIVITDSDGKIIEANKAAEYITGYTIEQMLGKIPALWGGQMPLEFYKNMWRTIKVEKKPFFGEITNRRSNGQKYVAEIHIAPILGAKRKILFFVGVERDITKEKEIDRAKTEFVSLASHQLRTPLTAVSWYTEMLQGKGAERLSEDQKKYLSRIYQSNRRMISLVNALLNVSRIEMGTFSIEPRMASLVGLADGVLRDLSPLVIEKNIKLQKKYGKNIPKKIKIDEQLVRVIIQNLLSNAIKYTPSGGRIKFLVEKDDKDIKIVVADNGYGIPKRQQEYIFTKLFRADNIKVKDTDGTGLGLYLVKSVLDSVGGKIWFKSTENKGTTFYVLLPLSGMKAKPGSKHLEFGEQMV